MAYRTFSVHVVLFCLCGLIDRTRLSSAEDNLVFTSILYRHGDRSPIEVFPKDPVPPSFWYEGLSQLSKLGMMQHYYLGEFFYQRYTEELKSKYLFNNYTRTQIYVRSTDVDRTLMSAQCQLSGLFKPDEEQEFLPGFPWQPIPIHTVPTEQDSLLRGYDVNCPNYQQLRNDIPNTQEYKDINAKYKDFFKFLAEKSGLNEVNMSNVWIIADTAYVQHVHNKSLSWVNSSVLNNLTMLSGYDFKFMFDSKSKSRLGCGRLVQSMVDEMNMKANGSCPEEKIHFYSAHDTTVACLLSAFSSYDNKAPAYASSVIVEFYRSSNDFYVKVWYKYGPLVNASGGLLCNSTSNHTFHNTEECLRPLTIPGCSNFRCPFKEFVQAVSDVTPSDWDKECGIPPPASSTDSADGFCFIAIITTAIAAFFLVVLVAVVATMCACHCCKRRAKRGHRYDLMASDGT